MGDQSAVTGDQQRERACPPAPRRRRSIGRGAVVGGAVAFGIAWLLVAGPVSADGGPHIRDSNSGISTLTADSCAGCHRAHAADAPMLLGAADDELCLDCHGAAGAGATTNVADGVQYADGDDPLAAVAGALRSGSFVNARIDSANPTRISFPRIRRGEVIADFSSLVPV